MTYKVFGGTLSLTQSINLQSLPAILPAPLCTKVASIFFISIPMKCPIYSHSAVVQNGISLGPAVVFKLCVSYAPKH